MYNANHIKFTFEGDTGQGEDIWSTGVRVGRSESLDFEIGDGILESALPIAVDAWTALWSSISTRIPQYFRTLTVKAASIDRNGRYPEGVEASVLNLETPLVGGATTGSIKAPQSTVVASLRTTAERGYATKGRMYLPANAMSMNGTSGRIGSQSQIDQIGDAMATFISALNFNLGDQNFRPKIMSQVGNGASRDITRVLIGDVLDTQRRRKNAYDEEYTPYNVT